MSTDAKSNQETINPKRRGMPYCKDNHIYASTVRITNLRSPCRAQCATWSRMRVSASSCEHGWRYSTSLTSFCVETIVSSFGLMITLLPVSHACMQSDRYGNSSSLLALLHRKASQFAGIGAPSNARCLCVVPLCVLR